MKQDVYKNLLVIVVGLVLFYFIFDIVYLLYAALGVGLVSIFFLSAANAINWIWLKFALLLGWINSKILLSIVYFVFLVPIALVSRIFTKDPLQLKGAKTSNWQDKDHLYVKEDLENTW